jgi:hypothetical protein
VSFRTLNCAGCKHKGEPMCRFLMDQYSEAEERIAFFAAAHDYHLPEVDVSADCKGRDFIRVSTTKPCYPE